MKIAAAVPAAAVVWAAMNYLIWRWTAASVQRMSPREQRPWNWRVLTGPFAYYPWLNRWEMANRPVKPAAPPVLPSELFSPEAAARLGTAVARAIRQGRFRV